MFNFMKKNVIILILCLISTGQISAANLFTDGCDLPPFNMYLTSDGDVLYNAPTACADLWFSGTSGLTEYIDFDMSEEECTALNEDGIPKGSWINGMGGFQFFVEGASILSASNPPSGFTFNINVNLVLGFSMMGFTVPAGCGTLVNLSLDGNATGLYDITISDPNADPLPMVNYTGPIPGCTDGQSCNYNIDANEDDGSCYGPSGCDNQCGSTAVVDDCGECGGDNSSCADCAGVPNGPAVLDNRTTHMPKGRGGYDICSKCTRTGTAFKF